MEESFIPDYSKYEPELLVDVYSRIDRENNPLKAKALDDEIKKRFNLDPDKELDLQVILAFLNTYENAAKRTKSEAKKYDDMIKQGWIAGVVLGCLSLLNLVGGLLKVNSNIVGNYFYLTVLVDILIVFGLSYGIYRNSRASAIIILIIFSLEKIFQIFTLPPPSNVFSILGLIVFDIFFIRSVIGTVNFHRILNSTPVIDANTTFCTVCGERNNIANYKCKCGNILRPS